jgi:hypothetical protein
MANLDNRSEAFKLWERSLAKFAPGMFTTVLVSVESEPVPLAMLSATRKWAHEFSSIHGSLSLLLVGVIAFSP